MNNIPDLHPPSSRRRGIQLCQPFEEKRLLKWNVPGVLVQPKLDGERCRAIIQHGKVQLLSSECNEILSVPHIIEELEWQFKSVDHLELDGELYIHDEDFSNIHSIVGRTVNIHDESSRMQYHIFDIIEAGSQMDRLMHLCDILKPTPSVFPVHTDISLPNIDALMELLSRYHSEAYEGIIVRHPDAPYERKRSLYVMKWKPKKSDTYIITGFLEEISKDGIPKGSLGALICVGEDGTHFGVGTGFTSQQRSSMWEQRESLLNRYVEVAYQSLTSKRVPRFPVFCRIIESPFNG